MRIIVKKTPCKVVYTAMRAQRTDFPVLACAVSCLNGEYRASVGARPARAQIYRDERKLVTGTVTEENANAFAAFVAEKAPTEGNVRGSAAYRTHLIRVLVKRCMLELGGI